MMELIHKSDALHAVLHNTGDAAVAAVQEIKAVKIVNCKDCKLARRSAIGVLCVAHNGLFDEDFYCGWGQDRKEQTDDAEGC